MGKHLGRFQEKRLELMNRTEFRSSWESIQEDSGRRSPGSDERN